MSKLPWAIDSFKMFGVEEKRIARCRVWPNACGQARDFKRCLSTLKYIGIVAFSYRIRHRHTRLRTLVVDFHGLGRLDKFSRIVRIHLAQLAIAAEMLEMAYHLLVTLVSNRVAMHQLRVELLHIKRVGRAVTADPILPLHGLLADKVVARNALTPFGVAALEGT